VAYVTLRFYGRFVLAQKHVNGKPKDTVSFLAIRFQPPFRPHHVAMAAPRNVVSTKKTKKPPTLRLMAAGDAKVTEHLVWDLAGCDVTPEARGSLSIKPENASVTIANLKDLESLQGRNAVLDQRNLHASPRGSVSAAIQVSAGQGTLRQVFPEICNFVPMDKKKPAVVSKVKLADVVDIRIDLPKGRHELKLHLRHGRAPSLVTIQTINAAGVPSSKGTATVTFTNLCSCVPRFEKFDLEFGQYYELLKPPIQSGVGKSKSGARSDRLIPDPVPHGGEVGDCNDPGFISF
jgi:hypothetical protein